MLRKAQFSHSLLQKVSFQRNLHLTKVCHSNAALGMPSPEQGQCLSLPEEGRWLHRQGKGPCRWLPFLQEGDWMPILLQARWLPTEIGRKLNYFT